MFYINIVYEIPISSQWYKKTLFDVFDRDVTTFYEVPLTPLFSVTQHHEKRWDQTTLPSPPLPSPLYAWCNYWTAQTINWNVWGVVKQEIAGLYQFLLGRMKTDIWIRFWFYIFELWDLQNSNLTYFIEVLYFNTGHSKP